MSDMVSLDDVTVSAAMKPDTFQIPSREMRERLVPGDLVKLVFRMGETVERMWVEVIEVTDNGYLGRLDNDPTKLDPALIHNPVQFGPVHVASIWVEPHHDWDDRLRRVRHCFTNG